MNSTNGTVSCAVGCWLVAVLGGILAAILLGLLGSWTFLQAVFAGLVITVIAGALLSWLLCKPLPALTAQGDTPAAGSGAGSTAATAPSEAVTAPPPSAAPAKSAAASASTAATTSDDDAAKAKAKAAADAKAKADAAAKAKADAKAKVDAKAKADAAAAEETAKSEAAAKAAPAPAAAEGDGTKPETLTAAREGGPDDLKQIKGVGPKLEGVLHSMGFYHFDQIAAWGPDEIAWADQNLVGCKGRVSRDDWVPQAKTLAAGGTTEFSKKVKKGGVY